MNPEATLASKLTAYASYLVANGSATNISAISRPEIKPVGVWR